MAYQPKLSAGLWLFNGGADRFNPGGYQPFVSVPEQLARARQVRGVTGVEVHQSDFQHLEPAAFKEMLQEAGLVCSNVNTNLWGDARWAKGSFTLADNAARAEAIAVAKRVVDIARILDAPSAHLWLGADGFDYPFQNDYRTQWQRLVDGIRAVAEYAAPDKKVTVEYKPREPRVHMSISDAGRALAICLEIGLPNLGVTIDFGHSLMARESPAEALVFLARHGKLFGVHFNDAKRDWDDDLAAGTINFWETIEYLYYCKVMGYDGWFGLDQFPFRENPVEAVQLSVDNIIAMARLADEISVEELQAAQAEMDAMRAQRIVRKVVFKD